MKAMVIGAAGFVGSYLIEEIKNSLKCDVVATKLEHEKLELEDVQAVNLNLTNPLAVVSLLQSEKPDYIFHLAAQSSVAYSWKNPVLTTDVNVKGTLNLLDAVKLLKYNPRVLVIGSGEEYGHVNPENVPIREECELKPGNIYAVTKACQNQMATIYANAYGLNLILVRAFNHFGPKQLPTFVAADFCKQAVMIEKGIQEPVIRVGNLAAKRDFTDVRDVVRAYVRLIQFGKAGETYNVGSGHAIPIQSILNEVIHQSTAKIQIEIDPGKLRPVDVPIIEADITKIYNATGWKSEIPLEQTIGDTLAYWRNQLE